LYNDIVASPKVYNARRTKTSFEYKVGETTIKCNNLQMEIDLTLEYQGVVTVVEGKMGFQKILPSTNYFTLINTMIY